MRFSRRDLLRLPLAGAIAPAQAAPDATQWLRERLRDAARTGAALRLPRGVLHTATLDVEAPAILIGAGSTLRLVGTGPLLRAHGGATLTLEGIIFDGGGAAFADRKTGLVDLADIPRLSIHGCTFRRSAGRGVSLQRCGGRFAQNIIEDVRDAGYFSLDGLGVDLDGNKLRRCGDNGVQIWTSAAGRYEGSRVRNNEIADIHNLSGGDGPYGNGIAIWGAGFLRIENNVIRRCAYTAVRNNAGHDVEVIGNDCEGCGERAMYAEFGAKRATFRDNRIDDAGAGIALANAERGTDIGVVTGNVITGLRETHPDNEFGPQMSWLTGVEAESNVLVAGNRIVGGWMGVRCGGYRQNIRVEDNHLIDNDYGVTFQIGEGVGRAVIARNEISGARKAAIAAIAGQDIQPGDVSRPEIAAEYAGVVIETGAPRQLLTPRQ
ncbi:MULTISPECIES: TIGR03808 family TAT-translocated repetitive protein [Methylosinus]|uniref:TIGR03808 family TAT-translocated repetitive protein n=1 Tax=Methylosinus trichosporium (strain ATCC 35070 / NCIMB 11131 / UNIQEM 75 / OB3b) TaxID=595536 RepID=A0A2D2D130_METT3|nr:MULTISPECIES: TIGR03808 family TAT-translocated repetitive protein [Methylosinus]ATQ68705.1 TIGR03808 family TAT-translocated repetitive protein [Methylosinus trichosporium OB3b]